MAAGKIGKLVNFVKNMGWRYVTFRVRHELMRRSGLLKSRFPVAPAKKQYLTLAEWKATPAKFFFASKRHLHVTKDPNPALRERFEQLKQGKLMLFNSVLKDLGKNYDWVTNPDSGFHYDVKKHWTEIPDYSKEAGDIKFVWEKSRFSYLYDIIRYDYHHDVDCSQMVFDDIISWINANPINCGPNYRCSQEMSLRVLNWTFALHYYCDSQNLTEEIFAQIQHVIYWHLHHIYNNIDFSRIAVRNNHAITETLTLYLGGLLYPSMPGAAKWKARGKKWFEEEIAYQVYEDGTFLQYSMNYHRIVAQLLTWAVTLADLNHEKFADVVYQRAKRSFVFLRTCMVEENGELPNYGANDGALFFKLNDAAYRDYRPQLQALAACIGTEAKLYSATEDAQWYGIYENARKTWEPPTGIHSFDKGGYYVIREPQTLTFIKCGSYKDRPQQADNLHIDIWYKGENLLMDAGSYKYNTDDATIRYFSGTASHNTVMLDDKDQMLKGGRFIWFYWTQCISATLKEQGDSYLFDGTISAFSHVHNGIRHRRSVLKHKGVPEWTVWDEVVNAPEGVAMRQLWHLPVGRKSLVNIGAVDIHKTHKQVEPEKQEGWASSLYGQKMKTEEIIFSLTDGRNIETYIKITD